MKRFKLKKRLLALLLASAMTVTMLPAPSYAEELTTAAEEEPSTAVLKKREKQGRI